MLLERTGVDLGMLLVWSTCLYECWMVAVAGDRVEVKIPFQTLTHAACQLVCVLIWLLCWGGNTTPHYV